MVIGRKPATIRNPPQQGFRPAVEGLETRECPADFWWTGRYGTAYVAQMGLNNWTQDPVYKTPATTTPGPYDAAIYDASTVVNEANCQWGNGPASVGSLRLVNGYPGVVQIAPLVVQGAFELRSGAIAQAETATLTVLGDFTWTGGVLNNSTTASEVSIAGPTATITPGAGGTLHTADRLNFKNSVVATISTGTVNFTTARSIVVTDTSDVTTSSVTLTSAAVAPETIHLPAGKTGTYKAKDMTAGLGLHIEGGTAFIEGGGTVKFQKTIPTLGNLAVHASGGALVIENGTTLDVGNKEVGILGATLATMRVFRVNNPQPDAVIKADQLAVRNKPGAKAHVRIQGYRTTRAGIPCSTWSR